MIRELRGCGCPFEVVICENGSTDGTFECARGLQRAHPEVQLVRIPSPGTGLALRHALAASTGDLLVVFETELVIRGRREGLKIREIPVEVTEIRPRASTLSSYGCRRSSGTSFGSGSA